jgi:hypothetical protein
VPAKVVAALGEDQARRLRPAVDRNQDSRVLAPVGAEGVGFNRVEEAGAEVAGCVQMITCTVPPSTLQAAPET